MIFSAEIAAVSKYLNQSTSSFLRLSNPLTSSECYVVTTAGRNLKASDGAKELFSLFVHKVMQFNSVFGLTYQLLYFCVNSFCGHTSSLLWTSTSMSVIILAD
ncbi:hypothetical protein D3C87_1460530 [compost metagenome]